MRKYALITNGRVFNLRDLEEDLYIYDYYPPQMIWVDVTDLEGVAEGWAASQDEEGAWTIAPYVPPPPTPTQILDSQSVILQSLKIEAERQKSALTNRIGTLQDAIDNIDVEGMEDYAATPEEVAELPQRKAQLTKWKNYAILLGRVTSQAGWPPNVVWPVKPTEGMNLYTDAFSIEVV